MICLANPKEDNENNTEWIIACNPDKYDVIGAFHELGSIDWTQSANIVVGDIVYIYVSNTVRTIKVKCKVNAVNKAVPTIDDSKFNKSDEFDGSKGRYMELEMIEEFSTGLFEKSRLEQHSFKSPLGPVRVSSELKEYLDIVQELLRADEMEPDTHDATYELIREVINSYEIMGDLSVCDYRDLDLVYLMSVGTWRHGFDSKKKTIDASHLPDSEKSRLKNLLDELGERAKRGEYANNKEINTNFGMFGTGLYTFGQKTDEHSPKDFIQMCIDIKNLSNDEEIFNRCERTLNEDFHGMRAASASMILHCLKPMTFPIFNSNMGFDNIYVYFNIGIKRKTELCTYIENVRIVKAFRDKYFTVKNYRIFDIAAWEIGKARQHTNIDYLGATDYYPSLNEYNPGITAEEYERILDNENIVKRVWLDTLYYLYKMGGTGSCKQITNKYGNSAAHYNMNTIKVAKAVHKETQCPLCVRESGENEYWPVLFYGRALEDSDEGVFSYKMREPLMEAIKSLEERGVFQEMKELDKEFDKNLILYGPPGTGKTYNSVIYAVAICDGKPVDELTDYAAVMSRYNELKKAGRISFTTFHQSYGYEEFIEGIKPIIDENKQDIGYTIEPGVFKKFCDNAKSITRTSTGIESTVIEENTEPYVFIIDEINRGNMSKIFGELLMLIENDYRGEKHKIRLAYNDEYFSVPENLYIIGMMNTADRSLAMIDYALRRRFSFFDMTPGFDSVGFKKYQEDLDCEVFNKVIDAVKALNIEIAKDDSLGKGFCIGHSYFCNRESIDNMWLENVIEYDIAPMLREYWFDNDKKFKEETDKLLSLIK